MITFIIPHRSESLGVVSFLNNLNVINKKLSLSNKLSFVFVSDGKTNTNYSSLCIDQKSLYFLTNDHSSGANVCRNIGLNFTTQYLTNTSHVIFFDDDDYIPDTSIEILCNLNLNISQSYYFPYIICNEVKLRSVDVSRVLLPHKYVYAFNIYGPPFRHMISLNRIVEKSLKWDEKLISCQDWDFYINLYSDSYKPILINNIILQYNESLSGITKNEFKTFNGRVAFYEKHLSSQIKSIKLQFYLNSILFFVKRRMFRSVFVFHRKIGLKLDLKLILFLPIFLKRL